MTMLPCVVVVSCSDKHPEDIIKLILNVDELPESVVIESAIKAYPWHIDTKYYTNDIHVCAVTQKTIGNAEFANNVEAVIINFDSNKENALAVVESWLSFTKEFEPEINILLCDRCDESPSVGPTKVTAQEWCIKHGFELVELNPDVDSEDEDCDFAETTGIKRIVQALHAHMWPNLTMKDRPQHMSRTMQSALNGSFMSSSENDDSGVSDVSDQMQSVSINGHTENESEYSLLTSSSDQGRSMEQRIDHLLQGCEPFEPDTGAEPNFESFFERLAEMKQRAQELPSDERKAYAEQAVMAFWRAIGGDEDEINVCSDDEEP